MFPFFMSFASITFQNKTVNTADRSCSPQDARRVQLPAAYSILAQMSFPTHKKSSQPYVLYSRCLFVFSSIRYATACIGFFLSRNSSNSVFSPSNSTVRIFVRSRLSTPRRDFASIIIRL